MRKAGRFMSVLITLVACASPVLSAMPYAGGATKLEPARVQSAGGAGAAIGGDSSLVWLNPGILATCKDKSLVLGAQRGTATDLSGQILWTSPLAGGFLSTGFDYYHAGNMEFYLPDGSSRTINLQRDLVISAGWGTKLFGNIGGGLNVKGMRSELVTDTGSWAASADLGLHLQFGDMVSGGVSFQNLGSPVKWGTDSMSQPALVRMGLAATMPVRENIMGDPADYLVLLQDVSWSFMDSAFVSSTGAEYQWNNAAFLRAGIRVGSPSELSAYSVGAGIRTTAYRLDYAAWLGSPIEMPHFLTLTFFIR